MSFQVGDLVTPTEDHRNLKKCIIYQIVDKGVDKVDKNYSLIYVKEDITGKRIGDGWYQHRFKLVENANRCIILEV